MTTVLLTRHGETTWNRDRRIQGWAPTPLTDRGREQARALGEHLESAHDVERIVSSDLARTRETTAEVTRVVDADVRFDEGWRERDFGVYQGFTYDELEAHVSRSLTEVGPSSLRDPEDGEGIRDLHERVVGAWEHLRSDLDGTTLVVTHGGPLYAILGHLKGLDVEGSLGLESQENCAVNEVRIGSEPRIVRENDTDHLD